MIEPSSTTEPEQILNDEPQNLPIRYQAFNILREAGFNKAETAKALKYSPANATILDRKLKPFDDLTSSKMVRLASKAHRMILGHFTNPDANPLKSQIDIKGSDVTKAIDRTYDRVQPIKRGDDRPASITIIQVNIDGY